MPSGMWPALLLLLGGGAAAGAWQSEDTGSDAALRALAFRDASTGLAVGEGFEVLRTTDGGASWEPTMGGDIALGWFGVAWEGSHAWVAGRNAVFQPVVGHSDDDGRSWKLRAFYVGNSEAVLRGIAVIEGCAVIPAALWNGKGAVVRSCDGGATWPVVLATDDALFAIDAEAGTLVAGGASGLFRSLDAGATWSPAAGPLGATVVGLEMLPGGVGFAATHEGVVLRTDDAGASWRTLRGLPGEPTAVAFADASWGVIVGRGGVAWRTSDGGETWVAEPTRTSRDLLGAEAHSWRGSPEAWATGLAGTLLHRAGAGFTT